MITLPDQCEKCQSRELVWKIVGPHPRAIADCGNCGEVVIVLVGAQIIELLSAYRSEHTPVQVERNLTHEAMSMPSPAIGWYAMFNSKHHVRQPLVGWVLCRSREHGVSASTLTTEIHGYVVRDYTVVCAQSYGYFNRYTIGDD